MIHRGSSIRMLNQKISQANQQTVKSISANVNSH